MQEIAITPQEVKELLELIDRHGNHFIDDLRQAEQIITIAKQEGRCITSDNPLTASYNLMSAVFRIAYIAGQRSTRRGKKYRREPLPPRFTEPVKRENFGALYTMYRSDLPNGGGVTAQSMEELFGKEIARGAMSYVTSCMPRGRYWGDWRACKQSVTWLTQKGFNMAVGGYCNDFLSRKEKHNT